VNRARAVAPVAAKSERLLASLLARAESQSLGRWDGPLAGVWISTALLAFGAYAVAMLALARRRRSWRLMRLDGESILVAPATGPAVIGALRPTIVVPEWSLDLSREQRALMLEHERQHVRARDPLLLHAAASIALLMPWNLAAWWLNRRLREAIEVDCDARVLATGHDRRAYGDLLLDVCTRRQPSRLVLAPALFERTSSLTRRILAMYPDRSRFPRARLALGLAAASLVVALACDMPSPEVVAPDGKDQATQRLYGKVEAALAQPATDTRSIVARYFPAIARGEDGPSILFLVKSDKGEVVLTESKPAGEALRTENRMSEKIAEAPADARERSVVEGQRERIELREQKLRMNMSSRPGRSGSILAKPTPDWVPQGISALRPEDINTVDVSKHGAGSVAPNAVSLITITLKPGAVVPGTTER